MNYINEVSEEFENLVALRRHFHENPECGPAEQLKTLAFIESKLTEYGIPFQRVGHSGTLAFISGNKAGKTILLRSDTDALPIQEDEQNLCGAKKCVSKVKGVSHACGHDGHMAMLLTEAKLLKKHEKELKGSVVLLFEESEEVTLEIEEILKYIDQNKIHIDTCYATHVRWDIPTGKVSTEKGMVMNGFCLFDIEIKGKSGHGSRPDLGNSTIDCFNQFYNCMNQMRMKLVPPDRLFTWSIGELHAGTTNNVLPDNLKCAGTTRFSSIEDGIAAIREMRKILDAVCTVCGCTYTLFPEQFFYPVMNHSGLAELAQKSIKEKLGEEYYLAAQPWMASETFSYLSSMYPSVLSFTGIKNDQLGSGANHHTPKFDLDEKGLIYGAAAAICYAMSYLENPPATEDFKPAAETSEKMIKFLHSVE